MNKRPSFLQFKEYFSSGFFFCCGYAFALLPGGELIFVPGVFLFIAF